MPTVSHLALLRSEDTMQSSSRDSMEATDPVIGTWEKAKSKVINGPPPMSFESVTRTYKQGPDGIDFMVRAVKSDGTPFVEHMTYKVDGKYYPHIGHPLMDEMSQEQIDPNTILCTAKSASKVIGAGTLRISSDGKVLTMSFFYLDAEGVFRGHITDYDKQEG
ncbi:hypothetical protein [Mesorhizobium sp. M0159]|uniref:hypothetical protein n=1 Tax=Mesorhizobium sp. M0159 TaxID=2956900 RepID=UPI00333931EF